MKRIIALTLAASLSSLAYAATETYTIDTNHTKPRFEYNQYGVFHPTQPLRYNLRHNHHGPGRQDRFGRCNH